MKKFLAVLLAILTSLALVACGNTTETETDVESESESETETNTDTESESESESETEPESETEGETENEPTVPPVDNTFVTRDETVYVVGVSTFLNVRSSNTTEDSNNIVGSLKEGDSVKRVGYNETWSKIIFDGKEYYASSKYLSTKAPVEFKDTNETVYVKVENTVNMRSKPWADSEAVAVLENGQVLVRTGIAKEADEFNSVWSRVKYINANGDILDGYVNSKFITTEAPLSFADTNETVVITNCTQLNLRAEASLKGNTLFAPAAGTELQRIGIAKLADNDGIIWSRVMYQGTVCYAASDCLTVKTAAAE